MQTLSLPCGSFAIIDDEDASRVAAHHWYKDDGYACARSGAAGKTVRLHRFVMSAKPGTVVDHINGNRLDCRKSNLRFCTRAENGRNREGRNKNNTSGVPGVCYCRQTGRWCASITVGRKSIKIGRYTALDEAKAARRAAEIRYFGEFAPGRRNAS